MKLQVSLTFMSFFYYDRGDDRLSLRAIQHQINCLLSFNTNFLLLSLEEEEEEARLIINTTITKMSVVFRNDFCETEQKPVRLAVPVFMLC